MPNEQDPYAICLETLKFMAEQMATENKNKVYKGKSIANWITLYRHDVMADQVKWLKSKEQS